MDPQKARETLEAIRHTGHYQPTRDDVAAIQVGIQAITYVERLCAMSLQIRKGWRQLQNPIIDTHRSEHHIKEVLESPLSREPRH